jgi:DNA-binding PadR family transcriptional regulator
MIDYSLLISASVAYEGEMERNLLLLGLLRSEEMHGYQLNEFIDSHLDAMVNLKKPTAYRILNKMADDGWVTHREERDGNRPPRRVFAITSDGEDEFQRLLRENLVGFQPVFSPDSVGLLFLRALPPREVVTLLQQRFEKVESALAVAHAHEIDTDAHSILLSHRARHLVTEVEWLAEVIALFEAQSQEA